MWNLRSSISNLGNRKVSTDLSDEDGESNSSREEGLECPICWESFNMVENVPYVLLCGHTLCQNCVLGLQWAILNLPAHKMRLPFFVSCPWCNLLSFRFVYRGNLRFPRKNYFILWMVESLNGEGPKSAFPMHSRNDHSPRRAQSTHPHPHPHPCVRVQFSLHKSIDYLIQFGTKLPLLIILLLIIFLVIPGSMAVLALYLLITIVLGVPSLLVLYIAYPSLDWLLREIAS